MNPAHLLHVFATFAPAGPQVRATQLMAAFGDRFRHTIVAMDGRVDAQELIAPECDARVLAAPPSGTWPRLRYLRSVMLEQRPDLLLTYNWGSFDAVILARGLRFRRHVHHEDGFNQDEATGQKKRRVVARRLGLSHAHRVVVCSHRLLQIAREDWHLGEQVALIPNGIHPERFAGGDGERVRADLDIPRDALVIGAVGHLRPVKNFARLIDAAAAIARDRVGSHPVHLLLVGDGELRSALEQQATRRAPPGGRVHFAGHQRELRDYYAAMDVFALSSDSEQHPVALLEAMAASRPVASTDVGDVRPVLPPSQHPYVIGLDDADQRGGLTEALARLLESESIRRELGDANRRRVVEAYSFEGMVAAYRDLYESALAPAGRGASKA